MHDNGLLHFPVVEIPTVADGFHVQGVLVSRPLDEYPVVTDS
jgi:hypothetical protein